MVEKIDVEEFKYISEPKREKMLLDKVNEIVDLGPGAAGMENEEEK